MLRLPRLSFISMHYTWIIFCSLLAFPVLYPYGNLAAVDVLFFGFSGSTESGLNTVDLKDLATYQQVFLYVIPVITNLMFINAIVVPVRLYWFRLRLETAEAGLKLANGGVRESLEETLEPQDKVVTDSPACEDQHHAREVKSRPEIPVTRRSSVPAPAIVNMNKPVRSSTITFDNVPAQAQRGRAEDGYTLRIPSPQESENGQPITVIETASVPPGEDNDDADGDDIKTLRRITTAHAEGSVLHAARSIERATTSVFVLGTTRHRFAPNSQPRPRSRSRSAGPQPQVPRLSRQATVGRNSDFRNLTEEDRELLGGVEYRALKLLLRFVFGYFIGLHLFGVVCLLPWIHNAPSKYTDWLAECGIGKTWWALYAAQTMANNLGFTLTPDSMATFKDATWPMLVMTCMAFAGNTCYPVFLRLCIWTTTRLVPKTSQTRETLQFLLDHPRRCYTLLFPSRPTWVLFGTVIVLNLADVLLIIVLDLDNPAVTDLPMGPRILSALFQAASARHTGTSTLNLSAVNPAVQFSLLTMMYIAVFPLAISVRASNTYEERSIGIWNPDATSLDESDGVSYVLNHIRNQLSFDLWYIFLGTFLVCVAEARRIADVSEPSFSVFPVLFEVTSAYGNVGLSLGGPLGNTSMSGHYTAFSKVVVCFMMLRGRHRGLPYNLDRAISLPSQDGGDKGCIVTRRGLKSFVECLAAQQLVGHSAANGSLPWCRQLVDGMWRIVIGVGAIPAVLAILFRFLLPDSGLCGLGVGVKSRLAVGRAAGVCGGSLPSFPARLEGRDTQPHANDGPTIELSMIQFSKKDLRRCFIEEGNWMYLLGTSMTWFILDVALHGFGLDNRSVLADIWATSHKVVLNESLFCWESSIPGGESTIPSWSENGVPNWQTDRTRPCNTIYDVLLDQAKHYLLTVSIGSILGCAMFVFAVNYIPRRQFLTWSFISLTVVFGITGAVYYGVHHSEHAMATVIMVGICHFIFNFGANSLTFLIPAEIFPTTYRCFCHGISAAAGKMGSIVAVVMVYRIKTQYDSITNQGLIFLLFAGIGTVAAYFSWAYLPDISRRDAEGKRVSRTLEDLGEGARKAEMEGQVFGGRKKWAAFRQRRAGVTRELELAEAIRH